MQKCLLLFWLFLSGVLVYAQKDTIRIPIIAKDTISYTNDSIYKVKPAIKVSNDSIQTLTRNALKSSLQKNLEEFEKDKIIAKQDKFFAELGIALDNTSEYLKRGIDSARLDLEIANIVKWYKLAADGVFLNTGTAQTSRNLTITHIILTESNKRLESRYEEINKYLNELTGQKQILDSLLSDSTLLNFPKDSVAFDDFFTKAVRTGSELRTVYRDLKTVLSTMQEINAKFQVVHNTLNIKLEEVEQYRINLSKQGFKREFNNIWGDLGYARPTNEILQLSVNKNLIVIGFYFANHLSSILVVVLLIILLAYFLQFLKKASETRLETQLDPNLGFILKNPWFISIFIVLNVGQFFFKNPPFIFYASSWILTCVILTVLFWRKISSSLRLPWVLLVVMFIATSLLNSVLQASRVERWMMLVMAVFILISALLSAKRLLRREGNNRFLLIFVGIVVIMETLSIFFNVFGRYNMAKIALTSGIFNLVVVVLLLWTCIYINEIIKIVAKIFNLKTAQNNSEPIAYAPKELLHFPSFLNILLLVGWFILFMRNFYAFTVFTEPFRDFMEAERALGAYTFSIQSIANFFLIMFTATLLSKIITFFASDTNQNFSVGKKGLGSWLLLIRISIFSIAIFLAFAATGIAMDRIAIIFSALSVGIGFGLQTLVNNLVSGLIIAFEKPVNVGDSIDINGQSGTMKSIGFRSSVINTFDGSDVIIPNGDLLNAHLINWTLGDTKRRVEILVGVAYGTDLENVKTILLNILEEDERILKFPGPTILVKEFASSSIDFRILFWVDSAYNLWTGVKSDVLGQIDINFKKAGIEIPFAQTDVHIRSGLPAFVEKKDSTNDEHALSK